MIEIIGPLAHTAANRGNSDRSATGNAAGKTAPLQKQLIERLQQAILGGRLPAGSLLPSSRLLAAEMGVSRNTVVMRMSTSPRSAMWSPTKRARA